MQLTLTDVWSWRHLVDLSTLIVKQGSLLEKADEKTLDTLEVAAVDILMFIGQEAQSRMAGGEHA